MGEFTPCTVLKSNHVKRNWLQVLLHLVAQKRENLHISEKVTAYLYSFKLKFLYLVDMIYRCYNIICIHVAICSMQLRYKLKNARVEFGYRLIRTCSQMAIGIMVGYKISKIHSH